MRVGRLRWPLPERLKRAVRREIAFFTDAPLLAPTPEKEIAVLIGGHGQQLYVQSVLWPHRSRQEQDLETANMLIRAAQMMAASSGAVLVHHASPPAQEGASPNG